MKKERKETIQYATACVMLLFGIALTTAGFIVDPLGIISDGVLWALGQCVLYAAAVFGISVFTKSEIAEQLKGLKH